MVDVQVVAQVIAQVVAQVVVQVVAQLSAGCSPARRCAEQVVAQLSAANPVQHFTGSIAELRRAVRRSAAHIDPTTLQDRLGQGRALLHR